MNEFVFKCCDNREAHINKSLSPPPPFHRVKVLTWKKIMIRHREDFALDHQGKDSSVDESIDSLRKFTGFEEAVFDPHGSRGNHMDLGQLYQFLNEKGCCDVFQLYFGIEGR